MCIIDGVEKRDGETWIDENNACTKCTCTDGVADCSLYDNKDEVVCSKGERKIKIQGIDNCWACKPDTPEQKPCKKVTHSIKPSDLDMSIAACVLTTGTEIQYDVCEGTCDASRARVPISVDNTQINFAKTNECKCCQPIEGPEKKYTLMCNGNERKLSVTTITSCSCNVCESEAPGGAGLLPIGPGTGGGPELGPDFNPVPPP